MNYQLGKIEVTFGKPKQPELAKPSREPFSPLDGFREVSQEQFRTFLANYGKALEHHCTTICEPVSHGYYDLDMGVGKVGTLERQMSARQAYCVDDEGYGQGPAHFYVRVQS